MIPYSEEEYRRRLLIWGTVIMLTRWKDHEVERFILEPEEVMIEELQNDKSKL